MKTSYNSLAEIPEPLKAEYEERGGRYQLKLEGEPLGFVALTSYNEEKAKLDEFRNNNRGLHALKLQLEEKLATYKDVDPIKYAEMQAKLEELSKSGASSAADLQVMLKKQIAEMVEPLEKKLAATELREKEKTEALRRTRVENGLREVGSRLGVDDSAMEDFLGRGMKVFTVDDKDQVIAQKGDTPIFSKTHRGEPLAMEEFVEDLLTTAPHLFKRSTGSGADPAKGNGRNPVKYIEGGDAYVFGQNLEAIAKGDVQVR